MENMDQH